MCMTIRGAVYYGASLHISMALLFLGGFFVDILGISEVWYNPYATYFSLILAFLYICLFLMFGLLIFRGVEVESPKLIKGAVAGFLVLQMSAFIVYLALLALTKTRKISEVSKILENRSDNISSTPVTLILNSTTSEEDSLEGLSSGSGSGDLGILLGDEINQTLSSIPLVSVLQVISLVLGIVATFVYLAAAVSYVRSVSSSR